MDSVSINENGENEQDEAVVSDQNVNVNGSQDRNEDNSTNEHVKWSSVWGHFTVVTGDDNRCALCNHCRIS